MHIGLIGGIGPAATVVYYRGLVRLFAQAGRRLDLTIVNADVGEMVGNLEMGRPREQAAIFAGYIDRLKAAGCDAAALTSMGGHFCIEALEPQSSLPLINAVTAMERWFAARGVRRIGVMGTRAVMGSGIYGIGGVEVIAPDNLDEVHANYVAIAAAGAATAAQSAFFHDVGRRLYREAGVELVVLGGTDLSVAFDGGDPGFPLVDSAMIHVEAIAEWALA